MSKVKIIDRKSERSIMYEREMLSRLKNPYDIINYNYNYNSIIMKFNLKI